MWTVYKRELGSYFRSPVAYCITGFFMMLVGLFFWIYNILYASVYISNALSGVSTYLTFICPMLTMKLLADEKKNGTEVLLRTSPVRMWKVVVGKYLAAVTLFLIMICITFIFPIILTFLTEEAIPIGKNVGGYAGFFLLGATYISVGLFTSSITESQVVAAISGIGILLIVYYIQSIGASVGGTWGKIMQWISPLKRYADFSLGEFNFASVFFYISFCAVMVFITVLNVERKRWN